MAEAATIVPSVEADLGHHDEHDDPKVALTPPTSDDMGKREERMSSELSELNSDDDDEEIEPDHYFEGGKIPVFKPTMDQFRSFKKFIDKIDKYGMKSGIVKVIPPKEWRDSLPDLSEAVKTIKVKNPIMQEFAGQHGIYTQANIEKQRSYNLPEWKALTDEPHHQPPARRGERRKAAAEAPSRTRSTRAGAAQNADDTSSTGSRRGPGRPRRRPTRAEPKEEEDNEDNDIQVPPTPKSPGRDEEKKQRRTSRTKVKREEQDDTPTKAKGRQPKSTTSRRVNNRAAVADYIDDAAFDGFDYRLANLDEYTIERCKELEDNYWKTINYGQPMYGADMPGSLFDDRTTSWNVAKLENLLDVLGTKVPGVNTAYLYLGMWKATFAWHLEDVDLYSINYIHFGAPKQWYSISQEDARRFEAAMKTIWPRDAKNCSQFLRHKTYLISPAQLEKQFNIKVNRLVHYEGEFVITYPYGYHSGYNLGYNCAESVNFANESWLNFGRIAKKCECESDSVWVDVDEIERKLRGEPTPEYYEETDDDDEETMEHLPSPPPSVVGKSRSRAGRKPAKRKRAKEEPKEAPMAKKVKVRRQVRKFKGEMPCILCPNDVQYDELLPTDTGMKAHRLCADYTPETYISSKPNEVVCNVANIGKDRLELKCNYCRSKRGAVFQCSQKKCTRAFHATCAAAAGVQVDLGPMPTFDEEGIEYYYDGYDFRCRFHRPKKRNAKKVTGDTLENDKFIMNYAKTLKPKDVVQFQYLDAEMYQVYGGLVIENRPAEATVLVEVLPDSDRVEVEWKYLLQLDPAESERPKPSANAKPLPEHLKESDSSLAMTNRTDGVPQIGDSFHDPNSTEKWQEFNTAPEVTRKIAKVDLAKPDRLWHYLGKTSTEARPQYTEDLARPRHNVKSNFLDTVKPAPVPLPTFQRHTYQAPYSIKPSPIALPPQTPIQPQVQRQLQPQIQPYDRPYQYKPKAEATYRAPVYNYSPDTRKNPNSPVAHQPNVVYDHRTSQQYGQQSYANGHPHRPSHTFHQYNPAQSAPPQNAASWKAPAQSGPLLNGIDQYAAASHSLPPYPYQAPPPADTTRQLPPFPYAHSQGPAQNPGYSPPAQSVSRAKPPTPAQGAAPLANILSKPVATSNTPMYANAPPSSSAFTAHNSSSLEYITHVSKYPYLKNAYLRRAKTYISPYSQDGGFTDFGRKLTANGAPTNPVIIPRLPPTPTRSSEAPGLNYSGGVAPNLPPPRPTLQFQSADAFQRDMAKTPASYSGTPRWESMMRQISSHSGTPIASPIPRNLPPIDPQLSRPIPPKSYTPPGPYPSDLRPIHMERPKSPKRPEYSPISDTEKGTAQPQQPQIHAGETWKYS